MVLKIIQILLQKQTRYSNTVARIISLYGTMILPLLTSGFQLLDLSEAANQPFHKHDLVTVFNGEIYNYKELQDKLIAEKQVTFNTSSDTEVVVEMFKHYKYDCLNHFLGMFAFAIYNRTTGELFIARDHFGIKPLFYTQINGAFAFSLRIENTDSCSGVQQNHQPKSLVSCLNYMDIR